MDRITQIPNFYDKHTDFELLNIKIPETNNSNVMGIYVECHGQVLTNYVKNIDGVDIYKHNVAGFQACLLEINTVARILNSEKKALSLLTGFYMAKRGEQYLSSINKVADASTDMFKSGIRFKNPPKGWVNKRYTTGVEKIPLLLSWMNKTINLFTCTEDALVDFIGNESSRPTVYIILSTRENGITTFQLFTLIKMFKKINGVNIVRILDESCNNSETSLIPGYGFGGRKTKRHKRKTRIM